MNIELVSLKADGSPARRMAARGLFTAVSAMALVASAGCVTVDDAPRLLAGAPALSGPGLAANFDQTSGPQEAQSPATRQPGVIVRDSQSGVSLASETQVDVPNLRSVGTGRFTEPTAGAQMSGRGDITVQLVDVEVTDAVQQIVGDIMGSNYVVEDVIPGRITIQTSYPVNRRTLMGLLSSALSARGAVIIQEDGFYRIALAAKAGNAAGSVSYGAAGNSAHVGPGVQVVPLSYVSAAEMAKIIAPLAGEEAIARIDINRNMLILKSDAREIETMLELVEMFDVDWMNGMSFSLVTLKHSSANDIAQELRTVFTPPGATAADGIVRFVPIERLNSILAISPQGDYLDRIDDWINRLDRYGLQAGQGFYVIPIQHRPATEIAELLQGSLSLGGNTRDSGAGDLAVPPGMTAVANSTDGFAEGADPGALTGAAPAARGSELRVFADDANNSLVVLASTEQFQLIERVVTQLDVTPNQVLLEATIAEVTLRDDLAYGLTWFLRSGEFDVAFSDSPSGAVAQAFPGFSVLFSGEDARAALSAVASVTDVKVLSSPSLMVLDNRTASLQVGDQVPIVTQSAVSVLNPDAPIVNSVTLRDTGVILNVTPRVNDGGLVMLDIEQEVSDVVATQTSGIDSPTIQQRRISTSVAVNNGDSIALGGMIRDRKTDVSTKVPLLGDIPLLGRAFRSTEDRTERTELLVLITPRVITNPDRARQATSDLRKQMQAVSREIALNALTNIADDGEDRAK